MPVLAVSGMSCAHCVRAVTAAVHAIDPQATVSIDLDTGIVEVAGSRADPTTLTDAIAAEGYAATLLQG